MPVWWLTFVALAAAAFHQVMLLLPIAVMIGVPVLFYGNVVLCAVALVAFGGLAWLVQPTWHSGVDAVPRHQAPDLYAEVDALADALQAPRVHHIALDDSLNAGALERHRGLSLRPTRRVMVLGLPMLRLLDADAARAVIAHELGHFSHRHGRLGHWLYRTREAWSDWAGAEDEHGGSGDTSPWERAARTFGQRFVPWFRTHSEAHSRCCEFEADAVAVRCTRPAALARALMLLTWADVLQAEQGRGRLRTRLRNLDAPPDDWALWSAELHTASRPDDDMLAALLGAHQPRGSHPSHADRLAALGCLPQQLDLAPTRFDDSAAAAWLGSHWTASCRRESPWRSQASRIEWAVAHAALNGIDDLALPDPDETPAAVGPASRRSAARRRRVAACATLEGRIDAHRLDPEIADAVRRGLAAHPVIAQAWAFHVAMPEAPGGAAMLSLVLRVDPARLHALEIHESDVMAAVDGLLRWLLPAEAEWHVLLRYTSEGMPSTLAPWATQAAALKW